MGDRVFAAAFGVSVALHVLLLAGQLLSLRWLSSPKKPIEVIYEQPLPQETLRVLQAQLAKAERSLTASPSPSIGGSQPQIRIPERPAVVLDAAALARLPERSAVVDLTNLADAARGDPVLLSYFSALREQIQRTANGQEWLTGQIPQGLVYIAFFLSPSGGVQQVEVIGDRSISDKELWDVAVRIVKQSAPFLPFPPSMAREDGKTIVVPLEFLVGS